MKPAAPVTRMAMAEPSLPHFRQRGLPLADQAIHFDAVGWHEIAQELDVALDDRARLAGCDDTTLRKQDDLIRHAQGSRHVVRNDDARHAETVARLEDEIVYHAARDGIEAARRL